MSIPTLTHIRNDLKSIKNRLDNTLTKEDAKKFLTKEDAKNFLTKEDAKNFATKDDLKNFATKDDLRNFATKDDLKKFATKDDLKKEIGRVIDYLEDFSIRDPRMTKLEGAVANHEVRLRTIEQNH